MEPTRVIAIDYLNEYDLGKFMEKYSHSSQDKQPLSQHPYTNTLSTFLGNSPFSTQAEPRRDGGNEPEKIIADPFKVKGPGLIQMHCNNCQFRHSSQHNAKISEEPIQKMKEERFGIVQALSDCYRIRKDKVQLSQQDTTDFDQDTIISSQELKEREEVQPVKGVNTVPRKTTQLVLQKKPSIIVSIPSRKTIESSLIHTKTDCIPMSRENSSKSFLTKQQQSSSLVSCKTNSYPIVQPVLKHQHTMVVPTKRLSFGDIDDEVLTEVPQKDNFAISPTPIVENLPDLSDIEFEEKQIHETKPRKNKYQQRQRISEIKKQGNTYPTTYQFIKPRISETIQLSETSLYHVRSSSTQSNCYSLPTKVHLNLNCDMKEDPDVYIPPSI
ncbi:hypothetical protein EDI_306000 [Entamoeba dispar SAW760]|uniref:Uncharacterized protein n=1 Tax=Entamoeba dispar (strain ATCC PRA-260 / SAW760) TaxID=370354 RepID=B0EMI6_ENTDS|nr:uncharacterized protein EDI_306000 [Entamoeba dispar SAW760]EDR24232.1 hypothetical protein EDI_306000 [Entamoeba dispar SAW760]|eukprot:EDR24232.1 hypothetical protein EDI_306000 [Entamoeba dispar SAW760]